MTFKTFRAHVFLIDSKAKQEPEGGKKPLTLRNGRESTDAFLDK